MSSLGTLNLEVNKQNLSDYEEDNRNVFRQLRVWTGHVGLATAMTSEAPNNGDIEFLEQSIQFDLLENLDDELQFQMCP